MYTTALGFYSGAKDQTQVLMLAQQTTEPSPQLLTPSLVTATSGIKRNGVGMQPTHSEREMLFTAILCSPITLE